MIHFQFGATHDDGEPLYAYAWAIADNYREAEAAAVEFDMELMPQVSGRAFLAHKEVDLSGSDPVDAAMSLFTPFATSGKQVRWIRDFFPEIGQSSVSEGTAANCYASLEQALRVLQAASSGRTQKSL